ncbi:MAG: Ig-like domain-containing protein [Aestuariibacter sp.]
MKRWISPRQMLSTVLILLCFMNLASASEIVFNSDFAEQGKLTLNFADEDDPKTQFVFRDIVQLNDGGFLLAFDEEFPEFHYRRYDSLYNLSSVKLVRINAAGEIDSQYGNAGIYPIPLEDSDRVVALKKLSDGKMMLLTEAYTNDCSVVLAAYRLDANGNIDANFASHGKASRLFGYQNACLNYDYRTHYVRDDVAITENDQLLAIISSPGSYNSSFNGDIPVLIEQSGEIRTKSEGLCLSMASVGGSHSMICTGSSMERDRSSYLIMRHDVATETSTSIVNSLEFKEVLDNLVESEGANFISFDLAGNADGEAFPLINVAQTTYQDGAWQTVYDQRMIFKINMDNEIDTESFNNGFLTETDLPVLANAEKVTLLTDNHLLLSSNDFIARINESGELDERFANSGIFDIHAENYTHQTLLHNVQRKHIYVVQANSDTLKITALNENGVAVNDFAGNNELTFSIAYLNETWTSHFSKNFAKNIRLTSSGDLRVDFEKEQNTFSMQLSPTGETDEHFGESGKALKDPLETGDRLHVRELDDGAFLVLTNEGLYRYSELGVLDTGFAFSGAFLLDFSYQDVVVLDNGSILLAGEDDDLIFRMLRLTPQGVPDNTFGEEGKRTIKLGSDGLGIFSEAGTEPEPDTRTAYILSPDESLHQYMLAAPNNAIDWHFRVVEKQAEPDTPYYDYSWACFYKIRLANNGEVEQDFADNGIYRYCLEQDPELRHFPALVAQAEVDDGLIQVISVDSFDVDRQELMSTTVNLVKLDTNGQEVITFGDNGQATHSYRQFTANNNFSTIFSENLLGVAVQPDGKLTVAVQFGQSYYRASRGPVKLAMFRFNTDGSVDEKFGNQGIYWSEQEREYTYYQDFKMVGEQMYLSGELHYNAVVINLLEQNIAPMIHSDSTSAILLNEDDMSEEFVLLAEDGNGDGLNWFISQAPILGTVTLNNANDSASFTYQPFQDASGSDNFEITVSDWRGAEQTQSISVDIAPVNDAPEISLENNTQRVTSGNEVSVTAGTSDVDGDNLTLTWSQESGMTVDLSSQFENTLTFIAPEVSTESQIVITATVSDGALEASQTITLTILPVQTERESEPSSGGAITPWFVIFILIAQWLTFQRRHPVRKH